MAEFCDATKLRYIPPPAGGLAELAPPFAVANGCFDKLRFEFDARFLHLAIGQQPYERFVVKIDHLDAISP